MWRVCWSQQCACVCVCKSGHAYILVFVLEMCVCLHAVTWESDSTCGPDFIRCLSLLAVSPSASPLLWLFL